MPLMGENFKTQTENCFFDADGNSHWVATDNTQYEVFLFKSVFFLILSST